MSSKITMILEVLGDGKWHVIENVRGQMDFDPEEMTEIISFLGKYGFAEVNDANGKVRIDPAFKKILAQTTS